VRYELTTYEEDELEFNRCLLAARDKATWAAKNKGERRELNNCFDALDSLDSDGY